MLIFHDVSTPSRGRHQGGRRPSADRGGGRLSLPFPASPVPTVLLASFVWYPFSIVVTYNSSPLFFRSFIHHFAFYCPFVNPLAPYLLLPSLSPFFVSLLIFVAIPSDNALPSWNLDRIERCKGGLSERLIFSCSRVGDEGLFSYFGCDCPYSLGRP